MNRDDIQRVAFELPPEDRHELVDLLCQNLQSDLEPLPASQRWVLDQEVTAELG
jgi:hypothetical protein